MKKRIPALFFLFLISLLNRFAAAQTDSITSVSSAPRWKRTVEIGGWAGAERTPFWLQAAQWGIVPRQTPAATLRLGLRRTYAPVDSTSGKRLRWTVGIETVANLGRRSQVLLPEAFAGVRYGILELWGGRRRQIIGITDSTLSSGSYTVSGNALPIPQVQISTPDFVPLGFLGRAVALKGHFSHGWFNVPYIQKAFLHTKSLHGRFGRPESPVHFFVGLNHAVQWAGEAEYLKTSPYAVNGKLTNNFGDYLSGVILGRIPKDWQNDRFTSFDGANRIGNHLGHYDLAVSLTRPRSAWLLYLQHPYEDATGLVWRNGLDGLYGLSWQNRTVGNTGFRWERVVVEYLNTMNQAGRTFDIPGSRFKGGDNYFNHGQYIEGWSYFGRSIGTPLFVPDRDLASSLNGYFFPSNLNRGYYAAVGLSAGSRFRAQARVLYQQHNGASGSPFRESRRQTSIGIQGSYGTRFGSVNAAFAFDRGGYLPVGAGAFLSFRRDW